MSGGDRSSWLMLPRSAGAFAGGCQGKRLVVLRFAQKLATATGKVMRCRIKLVFLCHDHRLRGTVKWDVNEQELWPLTLSQRLDAMRPLILHHYPYMDDAIDHIELLNLQIEPL